MSHCDGLLKGTMIGYGGAYLIFLPKDLINVFRYLLVTESKLHRYCVR